MNNRVQCLRIFSAFLILTLSVSAFSVVINDFEGTAGNAIDWATGLSIDDASLTIYDYVQDPNVGIIDGTQALHVTASGQTQTLALRLDYSQRVQFMENDVFLIAVTVPANFAGSTSGWTEITQVTLNADGYGWHDQFTAPAKFFGFWENSPAQTATLKFDYSAAKASMPAEPGYIEIIFTTNSDGVHTDLTFDAAQLRTAPSSVYEAEVLADNPLGWVRFEDITSANGSVGSFSQPGAWQNYTYIAKGDGSEISLVPSYEGLGVAAQFNPGSALANGEGTCVSSYVDDSVFDPNHMTVELWMNSDDGAAGAWARLAQQNMGSDPNCYGLGLSSGEWLFVDGGGTTWYGASNSDIVDGQWHHVVVTYEQVGADLYEQCYIDGELKGTATQTDKSLDQSQTHLTIGSNGSQWYMFNLYHGAIDEVAFYGTVLSADRIAAHYTAASIATPTTCAEVQALGWGMQSDINKDCKVNLLDFAEIASTWMLCNDPAGAPPCAPTW